MKVFASRIVSVIQSVLGFLASLAYKLSFAAGWIKFRLDFNARPDDIFIVTYPRSGTTWMQMILYQLSSEGSMDIHHISDVVPFFERMFISGRNPETMTSPRIFKTHLPYRNVGFKPLTAIPKAACKYIYVMRNAEDVATSYYHFHRSHLGYKLSFETFLTSFLAGNVQFGSWFRHVSGWWRPDDPTILLLKYEDLVSDLENSIHRIAEFCGFNLPAQKMRAVQERCSFKYMKDHEMQFDHATEMLAERGIRLGSFLRAGIVGSGSELIDQHRRAEFREQLEKWSLRSSASSRQ